MANKRNCDLTGAPIEEGVQNYGRGSHLVNVDEGIHLTVTPGRRDGGNEGVDLSPEGFALALENAAASVRAKLAKQAEAKAAAERKQDELKGSSTAAGAEQSEA